MTKIEALRQIAIEEERESGIVLCKGYGAKIKLPDCRSACKLRQCKYFSGGYCYKKRGARWEPMGITGYG